MSGFVHLACFEVHSCYSKYQYFTSQSLSWDYCNPIFPSTETMVSRFLVAKLSDQVSVITLLNLSAVFDTGDTPPWITSFTSFPRPHILWFTGHSFWVSLHAPSSLSNSKCSDAHKLSPWISSLFSSYLPSHRDHIQSCSFKLHLHADNPQSSISH